LHHKKKYSIFNFKSSLFIFLSFSLLLTGCTVDPQSPDFLLFNSYFPSWLVGAILMAPVAVFVRFVFTKLGIDDFLPFRFFVYLGFWMIFTMAFWYFYSPR